MIALNIFFTCATMVIFMLIFGAMTWKGEDEPEWYKVVGGLFVLGSLISFPIAILCMIWS